MATPKFSQKPFTNQLDVMMKKILPFIMRYEAAKPFLKPVDYIAFGLPDYPKIIKNPIDLSTIKERLNRKFYSTFISCLQDFNLMLENCYIYNSPDDPIVSMGMKLKQYLLSKLKIMPSNEFRIVKQGNHNILSSKNKNIIKENLKMEKRVTILDEENYNKESNVKVVETKNISPQISTSDTDFEKCVILLNELMSAKYKAMNYLFLKPVDVKALGLTDYHDFVKYPIDLSTIKTYLEAKLYETKTAFINDIYLMLNNCILYNGIDTDIGMVCRRFQVDFENLYHTIFKEKCRENINDEALYILMKIKRKHKEIEEMIRLNTEKISIARQRIDMMVNMFEINKLELRKERKRKMLIKFPHSYMSSRDKSNYGGKIKTMKKNSFKHESD